MEPIKNSSQDIIPGQPRRPFMSDFAPRATGGTNIPVRISQSGPTPHPASAPIPALRSTSSVLASNESLLSPPPASIVEKPISDIDELPPSSSDSKLPKERSRTGHAGLVGLVVFVILTFLALVPLLPGKILNNFPGSSASFSTGDQNIGCIDTLGPIKTTQKYDSKSGFPIIYSYSSTSTIKATCDGKVQTATGGHSSQFNPVGMAIDIAACLAIAFVVAKIWRKIFGAKY